MQKMFMTQVALFLYGYCILLLVNKLACQPFLPIFTHFFYFFHLVHFNFVTSEYFFKVPTRKSPAATAKGNMPWYSLCNMMIQIKLLFLEISFPAMHSSFSIIVAATFFYQWELRLSKKRITKYPPYLVTVIQIILGSFNKSLVRQSRTLDFYC